MPMTDTPNEIATRPAWLLPIRAVGGNRWGRRAVMMAQTALITGLLAYVFVMLWRHVGDLRQAHVRLRALPLIASLILAVVRLIGRGALWHLMMAKIVGRFPLRLDVLVWLCSLVGKYAPGKVLPLLARARFYGGGAPFARLSLAFLIEACCSLLAAGVVFGAAVLAGAMGSLKALAPAVAAAILLMAALTHPKVLAVGVRALCWILRRPAEPLAVRWRDICLWTLLMALDWVVFGAGLFFLLRSLVDVPASLWLYVTGSFALAAMAGMLALFAPEGIGVREGVMATALLYMMPAGLAAAASLLSRLWITVAEAACAGCAYALLGFGRARRPAGRTAEELASAGQDGQ